MAGLVHVFPRRTAAEWCVRLLLVSLIGWGGWHAIIVSLATAMPDSKIEYAYALAPNDGRIGARLSAILAGQQAGSRDQARATLVAKKALRDDATSVEAVASLGTIALVSGDGGAAKRLFKYSQALSRRDLRTHLWGIENSVSQNDIAGALRHYDIALRTKISARALLYPVLASAIGDPNVRTALLKTLTRRPAWAGDFVDYVGMNDFEARSAAQLLGDLHNARFPVSSRASNALIARLLAGRQYDHAWRYYATTHRGADRRQSRDPVFAAMPDRPSLFDWVPMNGPGISTAIQPDHRGGIFEFSVAPSVGGLLLQQVQVLPPGEYVLQGHSSGIDQQEDARPYWTLRCDNGQRLGQYIIPSSPSSRGVFAGLFVVPRECPAQYLELYARSSTKISGVSGQIDRVSLRPSH
jgi:hypothetical protein